MSDIRWVACNPVGTMTIRAEFTAPDRVVANATYRAKVATKTCPDGLVVMSRLMYDDLCVARANLAAKAKKERHQPRRPSHVLPRNQRSC